MMMMVMMMVLLMSHDENTIAHTRLALVWQPGQPLLGRPTCSTRSHPHTPQNCASQPADT